MPSYNSKTRVLCCSLHSIHPGLSSGWDVAVDALMLINRAQWSLATHSHLGDCPTASAIHHLCNSCSVIDSHGRHLGA
jgi:hypothetical protein